jgi:[acyl-carrier-protein] S-malonyltransferase
MQKAVDEIYGTSHQGPWMAAISPTSLQELQLLVNEVRGQTDEEIGIATYNTTNQIVVSGSPAAITIMCNLAKSKRKATKILSVSAPFHSSLMMPAATVIETNLSQMTHEKKIHPTSIPWISNVDGRVTSFTQPSTKIQTVTDKLVLQTTSCVKWQTCMEASLELAHQQKETNLEILEIGPGNVLSTFFKKFWNVNPPPITNLGTHSEVEKFLHRVKQHK